MNKINQLVISALEEIKGQDIVSIDVRQLSDVMDQMVICTGTSNRHVKSVADNLIYRVKSAKVRVLGCEGMDSAEWVLLDLGEVVVHIMLMETRDYYQIERLWQPFADNQFNPQDSLPS